MSHGAKNKEKQPRLSPMVLQKDSLALEPHRTRIGWKSMTRPQIWAKWQWMAKLIWNTKNGVRDFVGIFGCFENQSVVSTTFVCCLCFSWCAFHNLKQGQTAPSAAGSFLDPKNCIFISEALRSFWCPGASWRNTNLPPRTLSILGAFFLNTKRVVQRVAKVQWLANSRIQPLSSARLSTSPLNQVNAIPQLLGQCSHKHTNSRP